MITAILTIGLFTACGEQKKKEVQEAETPKMEAATETETVTDEAAMEEAEAAAEAEKRKLDSLQQVKEHGHAH